MQFVKRIGDNAVAVVKIVKEGLKGGNFSLYGFGLELFMKGGNIGL